MDGIYDGKTKRNIGNKTAVHHIQMKKVGVFIHQAHIFFQMQKIGGKQRRGYQGRHNQRAEGCRIFSISATY